MDISHLNQSHEILNTSIVSNDVGFLIGIEILQDCGIKSFHQSSIEGRYFELELPVYYNSGHPFIIYSTSLWQCYFTREDIIKPHKHFIHPSSGKRFNLFRCADQGKVSEEVKKLVQKLPITVITAPNLPHHPFKFRVPISPVQIILNREIFKD